MTLNVPITGSYGSVILATLTKATFRLINETISNTVADLSPTITSAAGNGKYVGNPPPPTKRRDMVSSPCWYFMWCL